MVTVIQARPSTADIWSRERGRKTMESRENTIIKLQPSGRSPRGTRARFFRRGNAVMEMALVLPILLALSFGTVEFGYFFYVKHTLQGAARDGARQAILPSAT